MFEHPWLRDSQQDRPSARCGRCRGEVYRGERMYAFEGRFLCSDCMESLFGAMTTREKAALLGAYDLPAESLSSPAGRR